jgi:hypothetical protein
MSPDSARPAIDGLVLDRRHRDHDPAEDHDADRRGHLEQHADGHLDQAGAPADHHHRAEHIAAVGHREDRPQVADQLRRVLDRVRREHDRADRAVADA